MFRILFIVLCLIVALQAERYACGTAPEACDSEVKTRNYDGSCNNLKYPKWGSAKAVYQRILPAAYDDGVSSYRKAKSGRPLPHPRILSRKIFTARNILSPNITVIAPSFSALLTHDLALTDSPGTPFCCTTEMKFSPDADVNTCEDIQVPADDPFYSPKDVECFPFQRSATNFDNNCSLSTKYVHQVNKYPAYIDIHVLYGSSAEVNSELRSFTGGKLKVGIKNGKEWFPMSTDQSTDCYTFNPNANCFKTGDNRVSLTPHFAILNVILLREHNRIANELSTINTYWTDEKIFQTTRSIMIGMFQHIVFTQLMPASLGESILYENGILHDTSGFIQDYDEEVNPAPLSEFSQAAFKHGHSMVDGPMNLVNEGRHCTGWASFEGKYNNVSLIEEPGKFDLLTRGFSTQHAWASDKYYGTAVTQTVFDNEIHVGFDTRTADIQRARDHGLRSYNDYREAFNFSRAVKISDFSDLIPLEDAYLLETLYEHPDDVEMIVAGNLEKNLPRAIVGPTFANIWVKQLQNIRRGDRFFYDHESGPFTLEQLNEIRKSSLSKMLCDNSDKIRYMQPNAFLKISSVNDLASCDSLPAVDLTKWKE